MKNVWYVILCFCLNSLFGQGLETQKWEHYSLYYPVASRYELNYNGGYKSTVGGDEEWKSIDNSIGISRAFWSRMDVSFTNLFTYKKQTDTYNTFEVRPTFGFKYRFNGFLHNPIGLFVRFENRHLKDLGDGSWTQTNRLRIRPEWKFRINRKSFNDDKLWYGIADAEWFATLDGDQEETFADRGRIRMGVGYRLNFSYRFEFIYILQLSRNTVGEDFNSTDSIFSLRFKQYPKRSSQNEK